MWDTRPVWRTPAGDAGSGPPGAAAPVDPAEVRLAVVLDRMDLMCGTSVRRTLMLLMVALRQPRTGVFGTHQRNLLRSALAATLPASERDVIWDDLMAVVRPWQGLPVAARAARAQLERAAVAEAGVLAAVSAQLGAPPRSSWRGAGAPWAGARDVSAEEPSVPSVRAGASALRSSLGLLSRFAPVRSWCAALDASDEHSTARVLGWATAQTPTLLRAGGHASALRLADGVIRAGAAGREGGGGVDEAAPPGVGSVVGAAEAGRLAGQASAVELSPGLFLLDSRRWAVAVSGQRVATLDRAARRQILLEAEAAAGAGEAAGEVAGEAGALAADEAAAAPAAAPAALLSRMQLYVPTAEVLAVLLSRAARLHAAMSPDRVAPGCLDPDSPPDGPALDRPAAARRVRAASEVLSSLFAVRRLPGVALKALADFVEPGPAAVARLAPGVAAEDVPTAAGPHPRPLDDAPEALGRLLRRSGAAERHRAALAERLLSGARLAPHGAVVAAVVGGCLGDEGLVRASLAVLEAQDAVINPGGDDAATRRGAAAVVRTWLGGRGDDGAAAAAEAALGINLASPRAAASIESVRHRGLRVVPSFWTAVARPAAETVGAAGASDLDSRVPGIDPSVLGRAAEALGPAWTEAFADDLLPVLTRGGALALAGHARPAADAADPDAAAVAAGPALQRRSELAGLAAAWAACRRPPSDGFRQLRAQRIRERGRLTELLAAVAPGRAAAASLAARIAAVAAALPPAQRLAVAIPVPSPGTETAPLPGVADAVLCADEALFASPVTWPPVRSAAAAADVSRAVVAGLPLASVLAVFPRASEAADAVTVMDALLAAGHAQDDAASAAVAMVARLAAAGTGAAPGDAAATADAADASGRGPAAAGAASASDAAADQWDSLIAEAVGALPAEERARAGDDAPAPPAAGPHAAADTAPGGRAVLPQVLAWVQSACGDDDLLSGLDVATPPGRGRATARVLLRFLHDSALRDIRRNLPPGDQLLPPDRAAALADHVRHWLGPSALPLEPLVRDGLPQMTQHHLDDEARAVHASAAAAHLLLDDNDDDGEVGAWGDADGSMRSLGYLGTHREAEEAAGEPEETEEALADDHDAGLDDDDDAPAPAAPGPWSAAAAVRGLDGILHPFLGVAPSRRIRRITPRVGIRRVRLPNAAPAPRGIQWSPEAEARSVLVTGLPLGASADDVEAAMRRCGEVESVRILDDRAAALPHALRTWRRSVRQVLRLSKKHPRRQGGAAARPSRRSVVEAYARNTTDADATPHDDEANDDDDDENDDDDDDDDGPLELAGEGYGISSRRAEAASASLVADPTLTDTPAGRVALATAQVDLLIDLASVRPGAFARSKAARPAARSAGLPRAVKRRSAELLEKALQRFPVHALVTFAADGGAATASSDPLRLFGVQVGPRACRVLPASDAVHLHVSGVPADMRPAAVAAALTSLLEEAGLRASLADGARLPPQALCGGEVLLRAATFRDAVAVAGALRGAELSPGRPVVVGVALATEWHGASKSLPPRKGRRGGRGGGGGRKGGGERRGPAGEAEEDARTLVHDDEDTGGRFVAEAELAADPDDDDDAAWEMQAEAWGAEADAEGNEWTGHSWLEEDGDGADAVSLTAPAAGAATGGQVWPWDVQPSDRT